MEICNIDTADMGNKWITSTAWSNTFTKIKDHSDKTSSPFDRGWNQSLIIAI